MSYALEYTRGNGPGGEIFQQMLDAYHERLTRIMLVEALFIVLLSAFVFVFNDSRVSTLLRPLFAFLGVGVTLVLYYVNAKLSKRLYNILFEIRDAYPIQWGNVYALTMELRKLHLGYMEEDIARFMSSRPWYRRLVLSYILPAGMLLFWGVVLSYLFFYGANNLGFMVGIAACFLTTVMVTIALNRFVPGFEMQTIFGTKY